MTVVVIVTASFPYEGGEQFIEEEIKYWSKSNFQGTYLLPLKRKGQLRNHPNNIKVLDYNGPVKHKVIYVVKALLSTIYLKEVAYILKNREKKYIIHHFYQALKETSVMLKNKDYISKCVLSIKDKNVIIYSYWNNANSYASLILKRERKVSKVFSRAHGGDLYEHRRLNHYMPLKWQFIDEYDRVFLLSKQAQRYYQETYHSNSSKLTVLPLGVRVPTKYITAKNTPNELNILSISYCIPLKQIHRIIDALELIAQSNEKIRINWTHIGDGPLKEELTDKAKLLESKFQSIKSRFLGHLSNDLVHKHLEENYYDCFLNVSKTEGMPVSIMEAMSYGIPAIAPDIGGISNLIKKDNGILIPKKFTDQDTSNALKRIISHDNPLSMRVNAREWISRNFNSEINYTKMVDILEDESAAIL